MDKDMDQELKKETKPREELHVPIKSYFLNYNVQTEEPDEDDQSGIEERYLQSEITFIGGGKNGNNYYESQDSSVEIWTPAMYEQQWREGIERIKTHNISCLMITYQKGFLNYWMLYKIGNKIHIQNQYLFDVPDENEMSYTNRIGNAIVTPENCYYFLIPPEEQYSNEVDEDGDRAEEWVVTITTIKS